MASQQPADAASGARGYKRASRKGAPRRFACDHAGCDKIYSRAEHLQRHQLNHNPKEIFRCDVGDCDQRFVRLDLLARHKKRHGASYTPRNRIPSFDPPRDRVAMLATPSTEPLLAASQRLALGRHAGPVGLHGAAMLPTAESHAASAPAPVPAPAPLHHRLTARPAAHGAAAWAPPADQARPSNMAPHRPSFYAADAGSMQEPSTMAALSGFAYPADDQLAQSNFAAWLFDPQSTYHDLSVASLPFLDGGLESTLSSNLHYDCESLNSLSPLEQAARQSDGSEDWIAESRRQDLLYWFQVFRKKQPKFDDQMPGLVHDSGGDLPALSLDMMRDCLKEFWDTVSPRLPIVHQHTFSANRCPIFLLLVMLSLGAASLRGRDTTGRLSEYGAFADVIVTSVRWEILTSDDSAPPVSLWAAQALLLLELYETLYSSRRLHERAHIYHAAFLTLLRRGSPLIGRAGSESPPEPDGLGADRAASGMALDSRTWWVRWAETEAMHRVVFAAFMVDIIHAAMFGHPADMAAHEIRLPLPCDDHLWTASSPDVVRQLDANLRMYGVKQLSFLDGLKSALHGKEVKTHSFGRMIILSGLLSVGWHLNRGETHLRWLELRAPPAGTHEGWRKMLLRAFGSWKESFDGAMSDSAGDGGTNGPVNSASMLFHLAHISLHADIVDCQVYAGARRLLGRKVSSRDQANAVKRMGAWAKQASTRHAILHAFKLLYGVLVDGRPRRRSGPVSPAPQYSLRAETDPHRPWIMYYAVLAIWAFVQAVGRPPGKGFPLRPSQMADSSYSRMAEYLESVATLRELDEASAAVLHEGLPELLDVMDGILEDADAELLVEARQRLSVCREMLLGGR